MRKEVLIDLTMLKKADTGLGSVARSFAEGFSLLEDPKLVFNFLVSPQFLGAFGDKVKYTSTNNWQRLFSVLLPKVDLWHSTFQNYRVLRLPQTTKQVLTIHDLNFLYEKDSGKAERYLRKMQLRVNNASAIVAISQFVANDIRKNIELNNTPLKVIYNSVNRIDQQPCQQPHFILHADKPFFFTIGQALEKKNFHVLLDVMKQFGDINLYICGGQQERSYGQFIANRIATEGIQNVFLAGPVSEQEKNWMYRHCTAFLFPSKFEGFGLPVIEAMQFGKPVFSSSMTSLPEVAGGNAFIWENFDPAYMVAFMQHNLRNFNQDQARIERIKAHAHSFNLGRHNSEYLQLYQDMLI